MSCNQGSSSTFLAFPGLTEFNPTRARRPTDDPWLATFLPASIPPGIFGRMRGVTSIRHSCKQSVPPIYLAACWNNLEVDILSTHDSWKSGTERTDPPVTSRFQRVTHFTSGIPSRGERLV
jgi:hypothetical protein